MKSLLTSVNGGQRMFVMRGWTTHQKRVCLVACLCHTGRVFGTTSLCIACTAGFYGAIHLESTQLLWGHHVADGALLAPTLTRCAVQLAMRALRGNMGPMIPPPRARHATRKRTPTAQLLRRAPDVVMSMTLVSTFGPQVGSVCAEGSCSGSRWMGQLQWRVARASKAV